MKCNEIYENALKLKRILNKTTKKLNKIKNKQNGILLKRLSIFLQQGVHTDVRYIEICNREYFYSWFYLSGRKHDGGWVRTREHLRVATVPNQALSSKHLHIQLKIRSVSKAMMKREAESKENL